MKKNYFILSIFFLVCAFTNAQEKNNSAQLNELLNRLNTAGNSTLKEPANLFTPSERTILQNHFSKSPGFNNSPLALGDAYMVNLRATPNVFGTIPATAVGPYTITSVATITDDYYGADFNALGVLYATNATSGNLETINIATGAPTVIAPVTGLLAAHNITAISWNYTNSIMYAMSSNGTISTLYTLNLTTGALTVIGNTGTALAIWLAIDNAGLAYMADAATDSLYSVNLTTGVATLIGSLGILLNFAQGADFDASTNVLYMAAYTGAGVNQYCSINTATGAAAQLGTINANNAECDAVAIYRGALNVHDVNQEIAFSIYPNPADSFVNIKNNNNVTIQKVAIYDIEGRKVKEINFDSTEQTINIAELTSGVYTVMIETENGKFSKKLVRK